MINIISSDSSVQIVKLSGCDYDLKIGDVSSTSSVISQNSSTIVLAGLGTTTSKLIADVKVSSHPDNRIEVDNSGLLVLPEAIATSDEQVKVSSNDTVAGYLLNKVQAGTNIGLSVVGTTNKKLKIDFTGTLSPNVSVADTATIDLSGTGVTGVPIIGNVKVSSSVGNVLTVNSDGLFVPASALNINDTPSVDLDDAGGSLTASVKISATPNNRLSVVSDGLLVGGESAEDDHKVRVSTGTSYDFLSNLIFAGIDPDGVVSLTITTVGDNLLITPHIDYEALCDKLKEIGCVCSTPTLLI